MDVVAVVGISEPARHLETVELLHCEICGRAAALERSEMDADPAAATLGSCGCGGKLSLEAPPRCPHCRSSELEPVGNYINYD